MPDPPIQLDEKRVILVGHIGEPVGVRNAELAPIRRKAVGSHDVATGAVLQLTVHPGLSISEDRPDEVSMSDGVART